MEIRGRIDRRLVIKKEQEAEKILAEPSLSADWPAVAAWLENIGHRMVAQQIQVALPAHPSGKTRAEGGVFVGAAALTPGSVAEMLAQELNLKAEDLSTDNLLDLFYAIDDLVTAAEAKKLPPGSVVALPDGVWRSILEVQDVYDGRASHDAVVGRVLDANGPEGLAPPGMLRLATPLTSTSRHAALLVKLAKDPKTFRTLSVALRDDREIVLAAVRADGLNLAYASQERRDDPEIIRAAMAQNPEAFRYASKRRQAEPEIAGFGVARRSELWNLLLPNLRTEAMAHRLVDGYLEPAFDRAYQNDKLPLEVLTFPAVAARVVTHYPHRLKDVPDKVKRHPLMRPEALVAEAWQRGGGRFGGWSLLVGFFPREAVANADLWVEIGERVPELRETYPVLAEVARLSQEERRRLTARLRRHGITRVDRFRTLETLQRTLDLRDNPQSLKSPVKLFIAARADKNGALSTEASLGNRERYLSAGDTLYFEVETRAEFIVTWKALGKRPVVRHIEGHGFQHELQLGADASSEGSFVRLEDVPELEVAELDEYVAEGSEIILDFCYAGVGASYEANMANLFAHIAPGATILAAPQEIAGYNGEELVPVEGEPRMYIIRNTTTVTVTGDDQE